MIEAHNKSLAEVLCVLMLLCFSMSPVMAGTIILTERDADHTIEIQNGDDLQVVLEANPSTGYVWEPESIDHNILREGGKTYIPGGQAFGAGGRVVLHFRAITSGETWLKLVYRRPFEVNTSGQRRFERLVKIK